MAPDVVSILVDTPDQLPSFAFTVYTDDLPEDASVLSLVWLLLNLNHPDHLQRAIEWADALFLRRYRPVVAAWRARPRPRLSCGATVTITDTAGGSRTFGATPAGWLDQEA